MPGKAFVEKDRHGRNRVVIERRGSVKSSNAELLEAGLQRESSLIAENDALRRRLSVTERDAWESRNLKAQLQGLAHEHQQCRHLREHLTAQIRETEKVEDRLDIEKERAHKLTEKLRHSKSYKGKYEEKWDEVEILKRAILDRDNVIRLTETRIMEKDKLIIYLKRYLREHGFYVE